MAEVTYPQRVQQALITQYETPTNGGTVTANATTQVLLLNPAGALGSLTVVFPSAPYDKQELTISSSETIGSLTFTSSKTVKGAMTNFVASRLFAKYKYNITSDKWFPIG